MRYKGEVLDGLTLEEGGPAQILVPAIIDKSIKSLDKEKKALIGAKMAPPEVRKLLKDAALKINDAQKLLDMAKLHKSWG